MKRMILAAVVAVLPVGCNLPEGIATKVNEEGLVSVDLSTAIQGMNPDVRSILPEETIETKMTQVTLASYNAKGRMIDRQYYEEDLSQMKMYVNAEGRNGIYALVNMGDMRASFPPDEKEVVEMEWKIEGYDRVEENGIPMCGKIDDYRYESDVALKVWVERLFAKLRVRILHKNIKESTAGIYSANFRNESLYLRQANARLMPFAEGGSRAQKSSDILEQSDYNSDMNDRNAYEGHLSIGQLGPGPGYFNDTTFVFYVPENVQGVLLPDNDDPLNKVYDSIMSVNDVSYSDLCTYVELNAYRVGSIGYSGSLMYKFFLGEDNTTDFSVKRNNIYDLTLDLTESGVFLDSWKVTRGSDWKDNRSLYFVDEPYVVYAGDSEDVMVHYNRYSSSGGSSLYPDEWYISYDEVLVKELGLDVSVDKSALYPDASGANNFRVRLTASDDSSEGETLPLSIYSWDGSLSDHCFVNIARLGDMQAVWDFLPGYVSQYGLLEVSGVPSDRMPLNVNVSDQSVISCTAVDEDTFRIVARGVGDTVIDISNSNGTQTVSVPLSVKAPYMSVSSPYPRVSPDGTPTILEYRYKTYEGNLLTHVDADTYYELLTPVIDGNEYFALDGEGDQLDLYIAKLFVDGEELNIYSQPALYFKGRGCPEAKSLGYIIGIQSPFAEIGYNRHYGAIDDYSLIGLSDTDADIRTLFQAEITQGKKYCFEYPEIYASEECVELELVPVWTTDFSYANQAYSLEYDPACKLSLTGIGIYAVQNDVTASTLHGAGRHEVWTYVKNKHSGERIGYMSGTMDVYVHTVVATETKYGCVKGSYAPYSDRTFAQIYNEVAGETIFSSDEKLISYMDVSAEYQTDISGVRLFSRLKDCVQRSQDTYEALSMLVPTVDDGYVDSSKELLYSVDGSGGDRYAIGGETYGPRKGIGTMLYRMLRTEQTSSTPSDDQLDLWFLGYDSSKEHVYESYSPCYKVHDLNIGIDSRYNVVRRQEPFYYSPSSMKDYRDADERGYHVIHFIEDKAPLTYGWKDLL